MKETDIQTPHIKDSIEKLQEDSACLSEPERACTAYVQEKVYRISAAVLSLCSLIEYGSAIRLSLETTALSLVKDASRSAGAREARSTLRSTLRTLHGTLETISLAGRMSQETAGILSKEVVALVEFMRDTGWTGTGVTLELSMLHTELDARAFAPIAYKDPYQTRKERANGQQHRPMTTASMSLTQEHEKTHEQQKDMRVVRYVDKVQDVQKDRRATILGLLQRKDRLSIKDVSAVIKDCSEKTIQRELLALVAQGVLVKDGERRWSTYRLA